MIPADLISRKWNGKTLSKDELSCFINGYLSDKVTEAQMTELLMAIFYTGMSEDETFALVDLGCGRKNLGDSLDNTAGIETRKGNPVYRVFNSDPGRLDSASNMLEETFSTGESAPDSALILGDL